LRQRLQITRDAWRAVGDGTGAEIAELEIICSDRAGHRRRVETRVNDIPGHEPPGRADIERRRAESLAHDRIIIDTAGRTAEHCLTAIAAQLRPAP